MSALLLLIGASDFFVATMFTIPFFTNIVQIFSPIFFERHKFRKKYILLFFGIYRLMRCTIVFIPLLFSRPLWMPLIFTAYLLANLFGCFTMPAYNNLCIRLARGGIRYWYMPLKQALLMIVIVSTYLIFGKIMDISADKYKTFILMYGIAAFASILSLVFFSKVKEPANKTAVTHRITNYFENIKKPLGNKKYRMFLVFTAVYFFSYYLSTSLKSVYLLKYIGSPVFFVTINESIVFLMVIILSIILIRYSNAIGWFKMLRLSMILYSCQFIFLIFTDKTRLYFYIVHSIILGTAMTAFNLSIFNYRYQIMPINERNFYEGIFGALFGTASLIAPLAGSQLLTALFFLTDSKMQSLRIIFIISALLTFVSFYILNQCDKISYITPDKPKRKTPFKEEICCKVRGT